MEAAARRRLSSPSRESRFLSKWVLLEGCVFVVRPSPIPPTDGLFCFPDFLRRSVPSRELRNDLQTSRDPRDRGMESAWNDNCEKRLKEFVDGEWHAVIFSVRDDGDVTVEQRMV